MSDGLFNPKKKGTLNNTELNLVKQHNQELQAKVDELAKHSDEKHAMEAKIKALEEQVKQQQSGISSAHLGETPPLLQKAGSGTLHYSIVWSLALTDISSLELPWTPHVKTQVHSIGAD